jgi:hypothetical protein
MSFVITLALSCMALAIGEPDPCTIAELTAGRMISTAVLFVCVCVYAHI